MSKTDEIWTLEKQGFRFVYFHIKADGTISIDMEKEGKKRNVLFSSAELDHEAFIELFSQVLRKSKDEFEIKVKRKTLG